MAYRLERAKGIGRDLDAIFDFLLKSALDFGEDPADAFARAASRVGMIDAALNALADVPHQGTLRPDLGPGLRNVTKGRAVFYFEVEDTARTLRVRAVFFGGQDHQSIMRRRAQAGDPDA